MNAYLHRSENRGHVKVGWLDTYHSFSFGSWYNPRYMGVSALRVINDDTVAAHNGFGTHPHDNMEIITIPLSGALAHRDSMGNHSVIQHGEVQVMSAGTGITHSEFNAHETEPVSLLQIWVFPNQKEVKPRYDQMKLDLSARKNKFQQIVSPNPDDDGVWIHQNAWFHLADMDQNLELEYALKDKMNGVYVFVIKGSVQINDETLEERDGMGIWNIEKLDIKAVRDAEILLMEVPMR